VLLRKTYALKFISLIFIILASCFCGKKANKSDLIFTEEGTVFQTAENLQKEGLIPIAIDAYEKYLQIYPKGRFVQNALLRLEELYFLKARYEVSVSIYEDYLRRYAKDINPNESYSRIEELYFLNAKNSNTITSYEDYLKRFPQGSYAKEVKTWVDGLYNERHPSLRELKTAKIVIDEKYQNVNDMRIINENEKKTLKKYLECAGLVVVNNQPEDSDLIFKIILSGTATGINYKEVSSGRFVGFLYTGASVAGNILIKKNNFIQINKYFQTTLTPPARITRYSDIPFFDTSPSFAPFSDAFKKSGLNKMILETLEEAFGPTCLINILSYSIPEAEEVILKMGDRAIKPLCATLINRIYPANLNSIKILSIMRNSNIIECLIPALRDENKDVRKKTAEALMMIKDSRSIESLISALTDEDSDVRRYSREALRVITGQDFYDDHKKWLAWYEANKKNIRE